MEYKQTSNKLGSSRLLKLTLIGVISLLGIKLLSYGIIVWVVLLTSKEIDIQKIQVYSTIIDSLNISISGSIAAMVGAVIARYGLRESFQHTNNFANTHDPINNEGGK